MQDSLALGFEHAGCRDRGVEALAEAGEALMARASRVCAGGVGLYTSGTRNGSGEIPSPQRSLRPN